ncbi:MAG: response regulator [Candidatus Delongbacteria bacterium]|nr:response regulator [Candidatus Delongbacteria bacterium]
MTHPKKNKEIPLQVLQYLGRRMMTPSPYLIILTHQDGRIINWQGDSDHFGYNRLSTLTSVFQLNPVFQEIYQKKSFPFFLPVVKTPSGVKSNFHLFRESRVIWVLFLESQFTRMVESNQQTLKQYVNQRMGELISERKHHLKTPLFTIEGLMDLLIEREQDPARLEKYRIVRDANREIIKTINDLLGDPMLSCTPSQSLDRYSADQPNLLSFDQLKIIVAEDNPSHQIILKEMLKSLHCEPMLVENGQDLITQLQRQSFHLILMDMRLPDRNGLEIIHEINAMENQQDAYLIIITTYCSEDQITTINRAGADEVIFKPINKRILVEKINAYLQNRRFTADRPRTWEDTDIPGQSESIHLKSDEREILIEIIQELKKNLAIFDPECIIKASTRLTDLSSVPSLQNRVKDFYRIAENFDDTELEEKVLELEQIIGYDDK